MSDDLGSVRFRELAAIQYHGLSGISRSCLDAIRRILQFGERPKLALLLTANRRHAFLLCSEQHGDIAIKSGFSSGYRGDGPTALANALCTLMAAKIEIEEIKVSTELLERLELSALTTADVDLISGSQPTRPTRWYDYIYDVHGDRDVQSSAWQRFPEVMPWHVIDERLNDLAATFFENPDRAIMDGFRRLEDHVRDRISSGEHGAKLFSLAFGGDDSILTWMRARGDPWDLDGKPLALEPIERNEQVGRMLLFTGAYQAFRNPRAHRVLRTAGSELLAEFLMLNQLFLLEGTALLRAAT